MLALLRLVSLRHMVGSPLRSLLTLFGVAVGVATLVGIGAINRSVLEAFRSTVDTVAGKADLVVTGAQVGMDESILERVRAQPGVSHASAGLSVVAAVDGRPGERIYVMGLDFLDDGHFRDLKGVDRDVGGLSDDLEFLNSTDRLLLGERYARSRKLKSGDMLRLQTPTGAQDFTIHGLLRVHLDVQGADGLGHRAEGNACEHPTEHQAHRRTEDTQHHGLEREERTNEPASGPQGAQRAYLSPPLHHADADRIIDKKHTDQQRHK